MNSMGILIFDMDGTLVNSMSQHADVFGRILQEQCGILPELSRAEYIRTAGQPLDEQFEHVLNLKGIRDLDVAPLLNQFWTLVEKETPVLFPDTLEIIRQLSQTGYILIVISGCAPFIVEAKMKRTGLDNYFRLMLGTDKNLPGMVKGEGHFKIIRRELELDEERFRANSALIGDSEYDMMISKGAGLFAIGRMTHYNGEHLRRSGANTLINNLTDLVSLLRNRDMFTFMPVAQVRSETYEITVQ